uniref:c-Myc binding protein n=1 Tax=Microvelia americana TaxID=1187971 RepID=A0A975UWV0_9HEMI|nr:c-Myc binding protein [Microvelia americana]
MTSYRPIDAKREEFRKYLERCGVMDALTRVLVMLYEEPDKPDDALEYVRVNLGDNKPSAAEIEQMRADLENALKRINELEDENCELRKKLYGEDAIAEDEDPTDNGSGTIRESQQLQDGQPVQDNQSYQEAQ